MTQSITFLLSALVALHLESILIAAAPLPGVASPAIILTSSTTITSIEATVTDVITTFLPPSVSAAATSESQPESTVTDWYTSTVTEEPTPTTTEVTTDTATSAQTPQSWTLPEMFQDLSPLGINRLAYGSKNIAVVTGIPRSASAAGAASTSSASTSSVSPRSTATQLPRPWTNSSSAYRIFYPSGSINPGNKPQGGSDFYATPGNLPLKTATNVTLEYSIFFPAGFAWVQGGKLPGIYGGHEGCSGGNDAKSCFSTRLMWRKGGAGELYLYAPKDKQTPQLCHAPPQSVCDADYGLSISRGSFHFAAGGWTHVSQTVRLNTPGKQDGGFELLVNGQRVIRRDDVFYRDLPPSSNSDEDGADNDEPNNVLLKRDSPLGLNLGYNVLPPLLPLISKIDSILGGTISGQAVPLFAPESVGPQTPNTHTATSTITSEVPVGTSNASPAKTVTLTTTVTSVLSSLAPSASAAAAPQAQTSDTGAIGFSGLFFSTFFGGHDKSWASPKDQYTWFKDFGMSVNA